MTGKKKQPSILGPILVAAAITLVVTLVRLVGELQSWGTPFATEAGGAASWLGIVWLVPVFGFWFGRRLAATGHGPKSTVYAVVMPLIGLGALAGIGAFVLGAPDGEQMFARMPYIWIGAPLASVCVAIGWPRAFLATALYALLARIPVIVIQFVAIANEWGTHYEKVHPKLPEMTADQRAFGLMLAQGTVWVPFTVLVAGLVAVIGAGTVRRR